MPTNPDSNGYVSGNHVDNDNEDIDEADKAEQELLAGDDEVVDNDEQIEDAELDRMLGVSAVSDETPSLGDGETPEQRRLETKKRHDSIAKYTAVDLGKEVTDPNHVGTYNVEARRNIGFFKDDFCEMVATRVSQALSLAHPLPSASPFNIQSWARLKQLGVDRIWSIVDDASSMVVKEVLGRRKFGRQEALALPKLTEEDQFKRGIYVDWVQDHRSGNSLYVGSATGECGFAGRWVKYDRVAAGFAPNDRERKGLHLSSGLKQGATMHLRPLLIFEGLDQGLCLLIEGLMMDFLGTIDRTSTRTIRVGENGTILHSPEMLEASKQAFPSQRESPDFQGLNAVSALKQMGRVKLPFAGCPMGTCYCDNVPCVIIAASVPKVVCSICYRLWGKWLKDGRAVSNSADSWDTWVARRKETKAPFAQDPSVVHQVHDFVCPNCKVDFKTTTRLRNHKCKACSKCKHVFKRLDQVAPHQAKCNGVYNAVGRKPLRADKFTCPKCGEVFTAASSLHRHDNEKHLGKKRAS